MARAKPSATPRQPKPPPKPKPPPEHLAALEPALPRQPVVVNLRALAPGWEQNPTYVYIGRPGKGLFGPWGNPIKPGVPCRVCMQVHANPAATLPCYSKFLDDVAAGPHGEQLRENVRALSDRQLVCFCHPRPCHGHPIVALWRRFALADPDFARSTGSL